jgi:uncharacterized coiled-coil DUF342 family protein
MDRESLLKLVARDELPPQNEQLEYEYVKTYMSLITTIDTLMTYENTSYQPETTTEYDTHTLLYLKEMQEVRKLVMASATRTLPLLRSIHQVEGIPEKERALADKLYQRDELSSEIIQLQGQVDAMRDSLQNLKRRNKTLIDEAKLLASNRNIETPDDVDIQKLQRMIDRSNKYAEEIMSTIVEEGLDWYNDPKLRDMVELCGEIDHL